MLNEEDIEVLKELKNIIKKNLNSMLENEERTKQVSTARHKALVNKVLTRKKKEIKVLEKIIKQM